MARAGRNSQVNRTFRKCNHGIIPPGQELSLPQLTQRDSEIFLIWNKIIIIFCAHGYVLAAGMFRSIFDRSIKGNNALANEKIAMIARLVRASSVNRKLALPGTPKKLWRVKK